jgi:hypothetical protein
MLPTYDSTMEEQFSSKLRLLNLRIRETSFDLARRQCWTDSKAVNSAFPDILNIDSLTRVYLQLYNLSRYYMQTKLWRPHAVKKCIDHRIEVSRRTNIPHLSQLMLCVPAHRLRPQERPRGR